MLPDGHKLDVVGEWVEVRARSVEVLRNALDHDKLDRVRLFISPVSDVYWPGEGGKRGCGLTRDLLELLAARPVFDWLLTSTRSDLVRRDIDIL